MRRRDDDKRRSKWSSREGERWWMDAVTYGAGALVMVLVGAAVIAIAMEELWVVVAAVALIALGGFAIWSLTNGDWWSS